MQWIKIEESIPAQDERVLVTLKKDYSPSEAQIQIGTFRGSKELNRFSMGYIVLDNVITHWMSLPAIPE